MSFGRILGKRFRQDADHAIRRARELGFTLDEIRTLLVLSTANSPEACAAARELAAGHLADVQSKIADLRVMAGVLADTVRRCDAGEAPGCPLIETLSRKTGEPEYDPKARAAQLLKELREAIKETE